MRILYPLLNPLQIWEEFGCPVASLDDLACAKLSAIAQRGLRKDFLDLYALGTRHKSVQEMLLLYREKYDISDISSVIYGLTYFDDADKERFPQNAWDIGWRTVKRTIRGWVKELAG